MTLLDSGLWQVSGSTQELWRMVFKDLSCQLQKALYRELQWLYDPESTGVRMQPTQVLQIEFRRRCALMLGRYMMAAKALFSMRIAYQLPPRRALIMGTPEYHAHAAQHSLETAYVIQTYHGFTGRDERPFVQATCLSVDIGGVPLSMEFPPGRIVRLETQISRHYRMWRRSCVRSMTSIVDRATPMAYGSFARWVMDYNY